MLRALELPESAYRELLQHCGERGIEFLSSPFDLTSLNFLVSIGVNRIKLGSGELTNAPMLLAAAQTSLPLILSTGMSTLEEVEIALGVLAFSYSRSPEPPSRAVFRTAWRDASARELVVERLSLLHCTTEYPTPSEQVNLRAMRTLQSTFGVACGYSDHTEGYLASLAAVALGASIIEKHVTLDRSLPGPDHKASLELANLRELVNGVREIEAALGDGVKAPMLAEMPNISVARKSLVAARQIKKGEKITEGDLTVKRPGSGLCPMHYWDLLGRRAPKDFARDELIDLVFEE